MDCPEAGLKGSEAGTSGKALLVIEEEGLAGLIPEGGIYESVMGRFEVMSPLPALY